jgi:7-cyano-7-deazaguanine synthase
MKRAIVLLSGGLDSATALYWAKKNGYKPICLSVDYGQRHKRELASAKKLAKAVGAKHLDVKLNLPWLSVSSLLSDSKLRLPDVPIGRIGRDGIPSTYVPGRNTVLVSLAISLADAEGACAIVVGANVLDFSGYPDCRPDFFRAFEKVAKLGTRRGEEKRAIQIFAPLVEMGKAEIVRLASRIGVPLQHTWSCYAGGGRPCGRCDSCKLRAKGFEEAGLKDPVLA